MIAFWMLWSAWIGALIVAAALGAERVLKAWRRATRHVWAAALSLMAVAMVGGAVATKPRTESGLSSPIARVTTPVTGSAEAQASGATGVTLASLLEHGRDSWVRRLTPFDRWLVLAWVLGSLALSARLSLATIALRTRRRSWERATIEDVEVLITDRVGPAVVGVRSPAIAIPRWVLEYDVQLRALVLAHEREHIAARDSLLIAAALAAAIVTPWNPATWWALARLRRAVEVDCDRRVLRTEPDSRVYRLVLLDAARRQTQRGHALDSVVPAPSFMHGRLRRSDFEHRLAAMHPTASRSRGRHLVTFLGMTILALAIGCGTPVPAGPSAAGPLRATITDIGVAMPTRDELIELLRKQGIPAAGENVEVFDEAAMRREYGVSKMPEVSFDAIEVDAEVRREFAAAAPGRAISGRVLVDFDIDETGRVVDLRVVDPPPTSPGEVVVAVAVDDSGSVLDVIDADDSPPDEALKRATHTVLRRLARFTPAELDGRPVPFRGLRIGFHY